MRRIIKKKIEHAEFQRLLFEGLAPDITGVVLLDPLLCPIALDRGARTILKYPGQELRSHKTSDTLEDLLRIIRSRGPAELPSLQIHFQRGAVPYICRPYVVDEAFGNSITSYLALRLERDHSQFRAIRDFSDLYKFSNREHAALVHFAMGLSSREVADRMGVGLETVKNFLRNMMSKLGVASRGEIFAKVLAYTGRMELQATSSRVANRKLAAKTVLRRDLSVVDTEMKSARVAHA